MVQSRVRVRSWLPIILAAFLLSLQIFSPTRVTQFAFWILAGLIGVCYYWCKRVSKAIYVRRERRHTWAQVGCSGRALYSTESFVDVCALGRSAGSFYPAGL